MHGNLRAQLAQVVDEVEREAVVVVDQDDHGGKTGRIRGAARS
jgi:hypothetical protein